MTSPDLFSIESDWLDRALMAFAPDTPWVELDDDPTDDQPLDELLAAADELLAEFDAARVTKGQP
jgi:hypothetical protein